MTFAPGMKQNRIGNGSASESGLPDADPLTIIYRAIWQRLGENPLFAALVPPPNRVRFDGPKNPLLNNRQDGQNPMVSLVPAGGSFAWDTSDTVDVIQSFDLEIESVDPNITAFLFPLRWAILQVQSTFADNLGLDFVHNIEIENVFEDRRTAESSSTQVWYHLAQITVHAQFSREAITQGGRV